MMRRDVLLAALCAVVTVGGLTGCPPATVVPVFDVSPSAISFGTAGVEETLAIFNTGGGTLTWTAREVRLVGSIEEDVWEPANISFLTLSSEDGAAIGPDEIQGEVSTEVDRLRLNVDRSNLPPGEVSGIGIEVETESGVKRVPISFTVVSSLDVSPQTINIPENSNRAAFDIGNDGPQTINWQIEFLEDPLDPTSVVDQPAFVTDVQTSGTVPPGGQQTVIATITREGLDAGAYSFFMLVSSDGGSAVVRVNFGVGGVGVFEVLPEAITLSVNVFGTGPNPTSEFTISNPGEEAFDWDLTFEDADTPGVEIELPEVFTIEPMSGTLSPGGEQVVSVVVNRDAVDTATVNEITAIVNASGVGAQPVTIRVVAIEGPRLSIRQEPPLTQAGLLDFGTNEEILTLAVGNTGGIDTTLNFSMTTDRPDLIKLPVPPGGTSVGRDCPLALYQTCFDWKEFPIVLDRSAMNPGAQVDGGEIRITAPDQEPITVAVSVTRAPLRIEGALNRGRPPGIQRFVFLLRNSILEAIDTTDPDILRNISFSVEQDGLPLELDETNSFVEGPEGLRQNVVLLLDFTGSMFRAGEDNGVPNGEFIDEMREGAIQFIDDLPSSFNISVLEYHEKGQSLQQRVIHPFSTDKDAIKQSIENFTLAPAEHGATELFDALSDAITALVDQDPTVVPFDDADVRSIVFVSDGNDTSSEVPLSEVLTRADENRVRMYPIAFGDVVNLSPLVEMATETGGHSFQVVPPRTLSDFLGTEDEVGQIWTDLERQIVLTYITLSEVGGTFNITAQFREDTGNLISGSFERDAIFFPGDIRAGQLTLTTSGIESTGRAEVFVRADYVPRNITQFRFRFIIPPEFFDNLASVDLLASPEDDGLLQGWRIIDEGDGVFTMVTEPADPLQFGAFGNLLRLTFEGLAPTDAFNMGFRVDNSLYLQADPDSNVSTKFFLYPGSHTNPGRRLIIDAAGDIAPPGASIGALQDTTFDPTARFAFDRDEDEIPDFDDPSPDNESLPPRLMTPRVISFAAGVSEANIVIRNNRLDTLEWTLELEEASEFGATLSQEFGVLDRGQSQTVTVTVDRTGLAAGGTFSADLLLNANLLPEPERTTLTVEVP